MNLDIGNKLRKLVVGVGTKVPLDDGRMVTAINFDNAATTPPFISVMKEINRFAPWYSSVHRGTGYKSQLSSEVFEKARAEVLDFVHADKDKYTAVFVKNTTEALNKLSYRLCEKEKKCVVLSTCMEHHSNDLPWRNKYKVEYVDIDECGRLSIADLEAKLIEHKGNVKLITVTGASNVTGHKNPIYKIARLAHKYGAKICVDGAQLVPHSAVNMRPANEDERIDYLAFSAHKMYAPFGIGVLVIPKKDFAKGEPDYKGGGTVKVVTHEEIKWDDPPHKEEAGSPNIMGVVALMASMETLKGVGIGKIDEYEKELTRYATQGLQTIKGIRMYGDPSCKDKVAIIPFNLEGIRHDLVAAGLSREGGIAVRSGCFCAQPYIHRLLNISDEQIQEYMKYPDEPRPGMVRLSFALYNTRREVDILLSALEWISKHKNHYIAKYTRLAELEV